MDNSEEVTIDASVINDLSQHVLCICTAVLYGGRVKIESSCLETADNADALMNFASNADIISLFVTRASSGKCFH